MQEAITVVSEPISNRSQCFSYKKVSTKWKEQALRYGHQQVRVAGGEEGSSRVVFRCVFAPMYPLRKVK